MPEYLENLQGSRNILSISFLLMLQIYALYYIDEDDILFMQTQGSITHVTTASGTAVVDNVTKRNQITPAVD